MDGIWISPDIMAMKRTPAERMLLARICFRAAIDADSTCRDSNRTLSDALNVHPQSVSEVIGKFDREGIVLATVSREKANERSLRPISKILRPYKEKADSYKEKTHSDYKEIPQTLSVNSSDPISQTLIAYEEFTDSYNKDIKPLENSKENLEKLSESARTDEVVSDNVKDNPATGPSPPTPAPRNRDGGPAAPRPDPFLRNRNAESVNVAFSRWWPLYQKAIGEHHCRKLWVELTDAERETALTHTPPYVAATPDKRYRKNPEKYLEEKIFNDEIIQPYANREPRTENGAEPTGQGEILRGKQYSKQTFGRSNSRRNGTAG